MRSIIPGALRLVIAAAVLSLAAGCGNSEAGTSDSATAAPAKGQSTSTQPKTTAKTPSGRTDAVPAGYIPYRCSVCGCRVFMGEGPNCTRPGCRHHWSDHQQQIN